MSKKRKPEELFGLQLRLTGYVPIACFPEPKDATLNKKSQLDTSQVKQAGSLKALDQSYQIGVYPATAC